MSLVAYKLLAQLIQETQADPTSGMKDGIQFKEWSEVLAMNCIYCPINMSVYAHMVMQKLWSVNKPVLTNRMQQKSSRSWQFLDAQKMACTLYNTKVRYCIHNSPRMILILRQMTPFKTHKFDYTI
jgi:hypothetical protein